MEVECERLNTGKQEEGEGLLTSVVSTDSAEFTVSTGDTGLDGDLVSDLEVGNSLTQLDNFTGGFVARSAGVPDLEEGGEDGCEGQNER